MTEPPSPLTMLFSRHTNRREFITLLGGAAVWPFAAGAQQPKRPVRIGFLPLGTPSNAYDRSLGEAFQHGLRMAALVENRDIVLDIVWSSGDNPDQAVTELIQRGAQLLIPCGSSASVAAQRRASTISIVFLNVGNPIAMGLVESLSHPGRNATGFSDIQADLSGKLVDVARELRSSERIVGYLWYTAWPDGKNRYQATEQAVRSAGMMLRPQGVADPGEINDAIAVIKKRAKRKRSLFSPPRSPSAHRARIISSAMNHRRRDHIRLVGSGTRGWIDVEAGG